MTMAGSLRCHPLIRRLNAMKLDPDDYVVFGSAPMFAHGLTDTIDDLDIVARCGGRSSDAERRPSAH
jgi:hypothetical protein